MAWKCVVSLLGSAALAIAGCGTKQNPLSCADGVCNDPAIPFCDTNGAVAGEALTCIAVDCPEPGAFVACDGDKSITCSADGATYEATSCELGCDPAGGCRLCEPSQTACTNGTVATCDASGAVVSSEKCALGCFEDEPRCREIDPSNNLGTYLDMVADPPALQLDNALIDPSAGTIHVGMNMVDVPNFLAPAVGNGAPLRVFVVESLALRSAVIVPAGDPRDAVGSGIAFVSRGDVTLAGEVFVAPRSGSARGGCAPGFGVGVFEQGGFEKSVGGGGGGNATAGAAGGGITDVDQGVDADGGASDPASGTEALVPLRGGCSGAYPDASASLPFANGGGAIQITSRTRIDVTEIVDVRGQPGIFDRIDSTNAFMVGGGGAGGSILLEAPVVELGANAKLLAGGGAGAACPAAAQNVCGSAGAGARPGMPATVGQTVPNATSYVNGGGCGGGLGRIRINTLDGSYTKASTAVEEAAVTTGTVRTR